MYQNCQQVTREQILADKRFRRITVVKDRKALNESICRDLADKIKENNKTGKNTTAILPVSPLDYTVLAKICNDENIDLANFCIMPTHIHLLIKPEEGISLSEIMRWIKTRSAKQWNTIHGSTDHMWGHRFYARAIRDPQEYQFVMDYIDQNPVVAELAPSPVDWKASGAYYRARNIPGVIDLPNDDRSIKLLPLIPFTVSRLIPPAQLEYTMRHLGAYAEALERLNALVSTISTTWRNKNPAQAPNLPSLHHRHSRLLHL